MRRDCPVETVMVDPQRVMTAQKRLKDDAQYNKAFLDTGPYNMLLTTFMTCMLDYQKAMMQNAQDRDMLSVSASRLLLIVI